MAKKELELLARKNLFDKKILMESSFVVSKVHLRLLLKNMTKNEFYWTLSVSENRAHLKRTLPSDDTVTWPGHFLDVLTGWGQG